MDARRDTGRWSQMMIIFGHRVGRFLTGRFFDGLIAPRVGYRWQGGAILKYVFGHVIKRRVSLKPILRNTITGSTIRQTLSRNSYRYSRTDNRRHETCNDVFHHVTSPLVINVG